jgi:hypothetical protein
MMKLSLGGRMAGRSWISALAGTLLGCALLILPASARATDDCPVTSTETAVAYLKQSHPTLNRDRIDHAIRKIRYSKSKPGIDALFQYLDFSRFAPSANASQPTGNIHRQQMRCPPSANLSCHASSRSSETTMRLRRADIMQPGYISVWSLARRRSGSS